MSEERRFRSGSIEIHSKVMGPWFTPVEHYRQQISQHHSVHMSNARVNKLNVTRCRNVGLITGYIRTCYSINGSVLYYIKLVIGECQYNKNKAL